MTRKKIEEKRKKIKKSVDISKIIQYNCKVSYSQYLKMKKKSTKEMKFKQLTYTKEDREKYGNKIPEGIQVLGKQCFDDSLFKTITIPKSVTRIRKECFIDCERLKRIHIPTNVLYI